MEIQITKTTELQSEISYEFFTDYADNYIKKLKNKNILTDKKVAFSTNTIRTYKCALDHFKSFETLLESRIRVTEISPKLLRAFELYLYQNNLTKNSVSLYNSKIKSIGNTLYSEGISFSSVKYATPKEITTEIYLSLNELSEMAKCKTLTEKQEVIRDVFILGSFLGMRYETLMKFLKSPLSYIKEHEGFSYIEITASKTNEQSVIPLSNIVSEILKKYNGNVPTTTDVNFNRMIKDIGEVVGFTNLIPHRATVGGKMVEILKPKFSFLKSHCMRRNFISNIQQTTIDNRKVCAMTGHKSVTALQNYSRLTNIDKIKDVLDHPFFKINI